MGCIQAAERQTLRGHVPQELSHARVLHRVSRATRLNLAIGLPLRNPDELEALLDQLSDPSSPNYHQFQTPEQFAAQFGPTEEDYQGLIQFAESAGLAVTGTHSNRTILDVEGAVADIEKAFHLNLNNYWHPVRGAFYAPDREPSLDLNIRTLDISGLDNFDVPRPMALKSMPLGAAMLGQAMPFVTGSGPAGLFIGKDFRAAYAPGVALSGTGQAVGLLEFDGFYASDVASNFTQAGLAAVPTQTVLVNGVNGAAGSANIEVILDIMMAAYMGPGLSRVIVYEGNTPNDILNRMATDNLAQQLSSSWGFSPINATTEQIFKQYIAQGQSFFQASGDSGAYKGGIMTPSDDPSVTVVGGTSLATLGSGGAWQSETTWPGSGGGVSTSYPIPTYQQGINMAANHGSMTMRNIPDVALTADIQMFLICNNGQAVRVGGTSAAAPLWAGFTALANQQASASGKPRIGFLNPLIYAIGKGANYFTDFHDISLGNNSGFAAASGYDLATGWGSPAGQHLIDHLSGAIGAPAFTLSASQSTLTIKPGGTVASSITTAAMNSFSGSVSLAVTGLPAGVTAAFSPASSVLSPTGVSTLTFTAGNTAAAGTSTITITGTSGLLKNTAAINLTIAVPNFSLTISTAVLGVVRGGSAAGTITIASQNGFSGTVGLAASGLPTGVIASFTSGSTAGTSVLTLAAGSSAATGTFTVNITGASGSLVHIIPIALTVIAPSAGAVMVNLAPAFNVSAIVTDGTAFTTSGLDGGSNGMATAYSANLLGPQQTVNGVTFYFGPANAPNGVAGKNILLPAGQFSTVKLLATAVNSSQPMQTFTVNYADGTASSFVQGFSDWFSPQSFPGESKAISMAYRDTNAGVKDNRTFLLYEYSFALNGARKVSSITLPNNRNVVVLAVTLTGGGTVSPAAVAVNLSTAFDTTGIRSEGKTFTGGLDGAGFAYAANLLGVTGNPGNLSWSNLPFGLGPADALDAVSGNAKAIGLPAGKFSTLLMLATGVNGSQAGQVFKVTYSDGATTSFTQSLSDWFKPQSFAGEAPAVTMQHRISSRGLPDNGPFYLYGYTFSLNPNKTAVSLNLPGNANVKMFALTLAP